MSESLANLRFDVYERVKLPEDMPAIGDLEQIELIPHVRGVPEQDHMQLKGHLQLSAVYRAGDAAEERQTYQHAIPVEISLPVRSVGPGGEVEVQIEEFDVELLSARSLNVTGILSLKGWDVTKPVIEDARADEEIIAVHQPEAPEAAMTATSASAMYEQSIDEPVMGDVSGLEANIHVEPVWQPFTAEAEFNGIDEEFASSETVYVERETELAGIIPEPVHASSELKVAFKPQVAAESKIDSESLQQAPDKSENLLNWRKLFISNQAEERFERVRMCIVQKEETILTIAEKYQLNPREIAIFNRLGDSDVSEGQILSIPVKS